MIDWGELNKITDHFGLNGLIQDILDIAEAIREAYEKERELSRQLRPLQDQLADLEREFQTQALEGKNAEARKAIMAQLRAESDEYGRLSAEISALEDQIQQYRDLRAYQKEALGARRSVAYLIGSILDACKAYRYYSQETDEVEEEVEEEIEIPF